MKVLPISVFCSLVLVFSQVQSAPYYDPEPLSLDDYKQVHPDYTYIKFLKEYKSSEMPESGTAEYERGKAVFMDNMEQAIAYNLKSRAEGRQETAGVNSLFDTNDEDYKKRRGYKVNKKNSGEIVRLSRAENAVPYTRESLPVSVDWRQKKAVTAVKDQKECGSCWVFGTVGALEGYRVLKQNTTLKSLSEQLVGSCNGGEPMCEGGLPGKVYSYLKANNNLMCSEESFPYTSGNGEDKACTIACMTACEKVKIPEVEPRYIEPGDDLGVMKALQDGPVTVSINASRKSFHLYKEGVYDDPECSNLVTTLDHAVLLVGYGETVQKVPYWIVKNSWGEEWGEKGYIRMRRGSTGSIEDEYNDFCGITLNAVQPVSSKK